MLVVPCVQLTVTVHHWLIFSFVLNAIQDNCKWLLKFDAVQLLQLHISPPSLALCFHEIAN